MSGPLWTSSMIFACLGTAHSQAGSRVSLTAPPVDPRAPLPPAVVILGNDAQLAARPATPVQLAHAALALGFRAAVPASWGDELVASASLRIIAARGMRPAIHCACPHVARRLL